MSQKRAKRRAQHQTSGYAYVEDAFGLPTAMDAMHGAELLDVLERAGATVNRAEYSWSYSTADRPRIHAAVQAWWNNGNPTPQRR